jgi:hypothetical protein
MCGSATHSTAEAATAASAALPPARITASAACVAGTDEVAAMADVAYTGERPGK